MDFPLKVEKNNPKTKANTFNKFFRLWCLPILWKSIKGHLKFDDLYKITEQDSSKYLGDKLEKLWNEELQKSKGLKRKPALAWVLLKMLLPGYVYQVLLSCFFVAIVKPTSILLFSEFVKTFGDDKPINSNLLEKIFTGILACLALTVPNAFVNYHLEYLACKGYNLRVALTALICRKVLRTSIQGFCKISTGKIINILSKDLYTIEELPQYLHYTVIAPLQVIMSCYFLWRVFKLPGLLGIFIICCIMMPMSFIFCKIASKAKSKSMKKSDQRIKLMKELLWGINIVKMYAWENKFENKINAIRKEEMKSVFKCNIFSCLLINYRLILQKLSVYISILVCILMGKNLEAHTVFSTAIGFVVIRYVISISFPKAWALALQGRNHLKRIEEVLLLNETQQKIDDSCRQKEIIFNDVCARWTKDSFLFNFKEIQIPPGSLCVITGPVGSGKSTLLQLLLNEISPISGQIKLNGSISYCSQEPWLFSSSIKTNILFGRQYEERAYNAVIGACDLKEDLCHFPHGDQSLVGERGIILSGGQRARINLARAIYRDADIYLLDDPISAVDAKVANHIFQRCIQDYLKNKTRVLVTHQLQFLESADLIIVLKNGKIDTQGTLAELKEKNVDFTNLLMNSVKDKKADNAWIDNTENKLQENATNLKQVNETENISNISSFGGYIKMIGIFNFIVFCVITFSTIAIVNVTEVYISLWIENTHNTNNSIEANDFTKSPLFRLVTVLSVLLGTAIILATLKLFYSVYLTTRASKKLHQIMFKRVLRAPMKFFYVYPVGRILNRFANDMGMVDEYLPMICYEVIDNMPFVFGVMIVIAYSGLYFALVAFLNITVLIGLSWICIKCLDILKHLEAITKSPVYDYLNSTLAGIKTIRSSNSIEIVKNQLDEIQDVHSAASTLCLSCIHLVCFYVDIVQCILLNGLVLATVLLLDHFAHNMQASVVSLIVFKALTMAGGVQNGIKKFALAKFHMVSVSRILEYGELETEKPFETNPIDKPENNWPKNGQIEFRNLYLKYNPEEPYVLKNLNIIVRPREKIGIVGRTGAGKSSLVTAIFRLANFDGQLLIDDVDTRFIGFKDLRSKISIIPQEPILFSDTIRYNLDPFSQYSDTKIWEVLQEVKLKDVIPNLDFVVADSGNNFSIGQRQLLCLARAILRKNQILILDEATANIDFKTDELIQKTIKKKFDQYTVLTIAHRLNTVMESDRILVMDSGEVVQFDHPYILSQDKNGMFYNFIRETNENIMTYLIEVAHRDYLKKNK